MSEFIDVTELLAKAAVAYREELERSNPIDDHERIINMLSTEVKKVLPAELQPFLRVMRRSGGGHLFLLYIPDCLPIRLTVIRRVYGWELKYVEVLNQDTQVEWKTDNLLAAVAFANDRFANV